MVDNMHAEDVQIDTRSEDLQGYDVTDVPTDIYTAFHGAIKLTDEQQPKRKKPAHLADDTFELSPETAELLGIAGVTSRGKGSRS